MFYIVLENTKRKEPKLRDFAVKENKMKSSFLISDEIFILLFQHPMNMTKNRPIISITIQKEIIFVISFAKRLDYTRVLMWPINNYLA